MYQQRLFNKTQSPVQIRLEPGSKQASQKGTIRVIQDIAPPLPLQDLCLLEVINDLDSYPVELLSSLPHWMRYRLLNNLPVLDLCQLDHTLLARGVDIDKVWKARVESEPEIKSSFLSRGMGVTRPDFVKRLFQMNVYQSNGSKNDEKVARIVLLKREMEMAFQGLHHKEKFINDKEEYLTKLTAHALSCSDIREIAHRLACLQGPLLSKQLQVTERNVWETQATSLAVLGMRYPTNYCHGFTRVDIFLTPHRLLPMCENADSIQLLSLLTHTCKIRPTSICLDIDLISQVFLEKIEAEKIIMDNNLGVSSEQVSCLSIMKNLLEDVVVLRVESQKCPYITGPMIAIIKVAMENGKLKSLFCSISNLCMELLQPLSDLFLMKTFQMLHLQLNDFSPQAMIKLLQAFMTSPCEADQKLVINSSAHIRQPPSLTKQQIATLNLGPATVPKCAVLHKTIKTNSKKHILLFLLLLPCVRLTKLDLHPNIDTATSYFHLCACHPDLHVKKLQLHMHKCHRDDTNELLNDTIAEDLQILLNKPTLQEILLTSDWKGCQEAKRGLIQGLQQQQMKPEFNLKSVTLNMLGYSDEEMRTLLEVIVSFPEDRRPQVYRKRVFTDAAKKLGTDYMDLCLEKSSQPRKSNV